MVRELSCPTGLYFPNRKRSAEWRKVKKQNIKKRKVKKRNIKK